MLNKMRRIIFVGTTSDECEAERKTIFEQQSSEKGNKERPNKKKKWIPKQFENLKRIGNEQHFPGHQVTGEEIIEIFGIRGGQFGNWTNNLERQHSLNYTFDAFADLAEVLGIERTSISLPGLSRGGLGLAFGARGRGDAVAHYEPIQEVINITKLRGAGSLGHEWSHALDHLIAQKYHLRGFASESFHGSQAVPDTFHKVMDCIYWDENGNRTIFLTVCTAAADMDIGHPLVNCLREHFPATLPISSKKKVCETITLMDIRRATMKCIVLLGQYTLIRLEKNVQELIRL